jgi:starch-binding outer membrane protein, SusD/RagB family
MFHSKTIINSNRTKMKRLNIKLAIILGAVLALPFSCKEDFLEVTPNGALDAQVLATADGVNTLLIGAYAMIDGVSSNGLGWESASSNWVYGSIRGGEANKGTDTGDQPDINPLQTYSEATTNPYLNIKWRSVYEGVSRCNEALKVLAIAEEKGTVTADEATSFRIQARVLRGLYHFEGWRMWQKIPYVDETTDLTTLTNDPDVSDLILADLQAGTVLPNDMGQVGRFNGTVARVLYAKALMQMKGDYTKAKSELQWVVDNGAAPDGSEIGLEPLYGDIFDAANRNGKESIYTIQYSVNDGSGGWNAGWGEVLNFPYKPVPGSPGGCCGFFQPSYDLVNSFKTDANGLPMLDNSYTNDPLEDDKGLTPTDAFTPDSRPVDPRLDWTVGRRGIPYLDWGPHTGSDWVRDQSYAGPYSPKKQVYKKSQTGQLTEVGNWTSGWTANGYRLIRFADVLLLLAECEIETNNLEAARDLVNQIRARAANPDGFVKNDDGSNAANYVIGLYNSPWTDADAARTALRMERKLELGMEGHRYFDLQRWGNVQNELNRIIAFEKADKAHSTGLGVLYGNANVGPEDVNYPVPQDQIDLSQNRIKQNR